MAYVHIRVSKSRQRIMTLQFVLHEDFGIQKPMAILDTALLSIILTVAQISSRFCHQLQTYLMQP